ncbi:ABC transporter B family member 19-like [Dorcoceras hygrometricum]|uniref:ABC transporter B family member 19-like n=1 Tax=Dorcoceras hygrometricum TaxID=472368 RepID=A0A2Z7AD20_9LAMI|nr:ABC transporter B family member 19-like [Dorcoceras hygrometricum]
MGNSSAYVSATVGSRSIEKTILLTSASSHMFRGNSDACVSATVESLTIKKTVLLTFRYSIVIGNSMSIVCFNRFDDVSHSRISDIMTSP